LTCPPTESRYWLPSPSAPQESFAAPARNHRDVRDEIETLLGQFRLATPPGQGASQHLPDRNAQVRNDVRPVVDVLLQRAALARGTFPHQSDRVDIEHERHRAPLVRGR
jgi:hypothetical protein